MENKHILLIEDDELTRLLLQKMLESQGYDVLAAASVPEAMHAFSQQRFSVILSDIEMRPVSGLELLKRVPDIWKGAVIVFLTGKGSLSSACEAISQGAFDYLGKPIQPEQLYSVIERACQQVNDTSKPHSSHLELPDCRLIGKSNLMVEVYKQVARASQGESNVLIWGESGTGKELIAKAIHEHSQRKQNRFVTVNCGALTETLLESELFGHIKGSFTGAIANKKGLFEEANGGTLFLDEIGDVSPGMQVKLLRVLQEGEFKPVGSVENRRVNVRVIAATHRNIAKMVQEERFREDLFYRLKVITLSLPPLRKRREDILPLARYFIAKNCHLSSGVELSESSEEKLLRYSWPGNIRELEHSVERAVAMRQGKILFPEDFSLEAEAISTSKEPIVPREPTSVDRSTAELISLEEVEKIHIAKVIKRVHYNKTKAAQILGVDRATLYRKAERYQISLDESSEPLVTEANAVKNPESMAHG
jgi:DNA-binding NtrC family response regulator